MVKVGDTAIIESGPFEGRVVKIINIYNEHNKTYARFKFVDDHPTNKFLCKGFQKVCYIYRLKPYLIKKNHLPEWL